MKIGVYANKKTMELIDVYLGRDYMSQLYFALDKNLYCGCGCKNCESEGVALSWIDIEDIESDYIYLGPL